jgi:hypothetical protein
MHSHMGRLKGRSMGGQGNEAAKGSQTLTKRASIISCEAERLVGEGPVDLEQHSTRSRQTSGPIPRRSKAVQWRCPK